MFFQHIYDTTLAHGSYLIGCQATGESIVIDAKRDIEDYLKIAEANKLKITHITETHIHADFLSGSRELAAVTGAQMYLSDEGGKDWQYEFPHVGLKDGDVIKVGNLSLEVMHTPGHTPESISFLLTDHPASDQPTMIFTGDFIFVGDIGRPDLLEKAAGIKGTQDLGAEQMYESVKRFAELPDHIQVWPAHGAGSACGKALGAVPSSTVGYERFSNWAMRLLDDKEAFIEYLLEDQPEPPKYFAMMKKLNKIDRPLLTEVPNHKQLSDEEFLNLFNDGITVIDARENEDYAKTYIPGTLSIAGGKSFANWAGWFLNYEEDFVLISEEDQIKDLTLKLMRIGLDRIHGYITPDRIKGLGLKLETADWLNIEDFKRERERGDVQVVDVRGASEFKTTRIDGTDNVFVGTILENQDEISRDKEVIIHCQSGGRAVIAYSALRKAGFDNLKIYPGGMAEWMAKEEVVEFS